MSIRFFCYTFVKIITKSIITLSRKRRELPLLEQIEIADVAAEGNALTRINDMVVFVPFGAPGDIVDIQLTKRKKLCRRSDHPASQTG